jgi:hypothetical protein
VADPSGSGRGAQMGGRFESYSRLSVHSVQLCDHRRVGFTKYSSKGTVSVQLSEPGGRDILTVGLRLGTIGHFCNLIVDDDGFHHKQVSLSGSSYE